jgi:hypothetical protein
MTAPPQAGFLLPAGNAADRCYDCQTNLKTTPLEQLKVFLEKVKGDTSLQEKLKAEKPPEILTTNAFAYEQTPDRPIPGPPMKGPLEFPA